MSEMMRKGNYSKMSKTGEREITPMSEMKLRKGNYFKMSKMGEKPLHWVNQNREWKITPK